jgi:hypothetical protein
MAGLLESLKNIQFQPSAGNMGLLQMGAQMLANSGPSLTPTNFGTALGQGLNGFTQGYTGFQDREREQAQQALLNQYRQAQMQAMSPEARRQAIMTEAEAKAEAAQKFPTQRAVDPYYSAIPTPQGLMSFNARTGQMEPINVNGQPVMKSADDVGLQGALSGAKSGNQFSAVDMADGSKKWMSKGTAAALSGFPSQPGPINVSSGNAHLNIKNPAQFAEDIGGKPTGDRQLDALIAQSQELYNQRNGIGQSTAAKKAAEITGKAQADAALDLPKTEAQADYTDKLLEELKTHPGMSGVVGMPNWSGIVPLPGTPEADFRARLKQVQGQQFLSAFETLKGGGQITEMEGKKATEAMGRLSASQSEDEFKKSITELQGIISGARERARQRAGGMTQPGAEAGDDKQKRLEALRAKHLGR